MFNSEIRNLLIQVITSWQVLAVTGVLIVYVFLVNYVAKLYHHPRPPSFTMPKIKKQKPEKTQEPAAGVASESDEMELEEEEK